MKLSPSPSLSKKLSASLAFLCLIQLPVVVESLGFGPREVTVTNEGEAGALPVEIFNDSPLAVTVEPQPERLTVSGVWTSAGLAISPSTMVVHDLFFYVESDNAPPCQFTMNYVIDNVQSRTVKRWSLGTGDSAEVHWEAGILASELRFGTIGGGTCVRNWMAVGFETS